MIGHMDDFMKAFSEHFRGDSTELRRQFSWQASYITDNLKDNSTVVDLGGGAGHLLSLISKPGLRKINVDTNSIYGLSKIDESLEFIHKDIFDYLYSIQDGSVDCFILTHVIEHLEFEDAYLLLNLIKAKTKIGGFLVLGTPNIDTLMVLTTFWLDPTHVRPYPRLLVKFTLEYIGFDIIEEKTDSPFFSDLSPVNDHNSLTLTKLFGDQNLNFICKNVLKL
jgi:2-polyprenyl-3-methyl-5-hydroxy-6-metoxy-1,4-benzoquinol methylase